MKTLNLILLITMTATLFAQIDKDQLSLDISKAEAANTEELKAFIWKKESIITIDGEQKLTMLNEISIDSEDEINVTNLDAQTTVKQKRGIRGRIQESTAENNTEYLEGAIKHALAYTYMSKGQLLDFFNKAEITDKGDILVATASDVYVKGDKLTIEVEKETKLFISKEFTSTMGEDPISGRIDYKKFTNGINHVYKSMLNLPKKKAVINSENRDYVQKVM